jgi:phospholipase C
MDSRREFFRKLVTLAGSAGTADLLLPVVERAAAIEPAQGTSYLDAEHVVILMQENRSFDHCFGSLQGVRGFNDPRAITLPDGNPVWLQTNAKGETFAPFPLNVKETNATWLGSLPHSWADMQDAKNGGLHDQWLSAKPSGHPGCENMPLTLGYYTRNDLPFYYALADAFTVCDQHFCSSLTGTTPNRLYLWSGTVRAGATDHGPANVRNSEVDYGVPASWTAFPERLEEAGVSWKIYQNEVSIPSGLSEEQDRWLANFTDNPIEWFPQYHVDFSPGYLAYLQKAKDALPGQITAAQRKLDGNTLSAREAHELREKLHGMKLLLASAERLDERTPEHFAALPEREQNLHRKAFTVNSGDPHFRELTTITYQDGSVTRSLEVPKGDVLHQFRKDVETGQLPSVSWIVAPEQYSDHPGAPWYGAWYVAEVLEILTSHPEIWKKTIFVLTYDENDGYFDHVPPFGTHTPGKPETGEASEGLNVAPEYVTLEQDRQRVPESHARGGSIGLGFRVPLVVASPWSRGGQVCSQVFDHTSVLQFLEHFASRKSGKPVRETNISEWRRTVCGDLNSVFTTEKSGNVALEYPARDTVLEAIHKAQFKGLPAYQSLSRAEVLACQAGGEHSGVLPRQESGIRRACPLPYDLRADARLSPDLKQVVLELGSSREFFGDKTAGSPFYVYSPKRYRVGTDSEARVRYYTVAAGHSLTGEWELAGFDNSAYLLRVHGPNGFFREFSGMADHPRLEILCHRAAHSPKSHKYGNVELRLRNLDPTQSLTLTMKDVSYDTGSHTVKLTPGTNAVHTVDLQRSFGWYDLAVNIKGYDHFRYRYAGHVENGLPSFTDPLMGQVKL